MQCCMSVSTDWLLFAMIRSIVKSLEVSVVEVAELTNRSHRFPP